MISTILAVLLAPTTVTLFPSDDIWVYPHAGDPQKDVYLRIWGSEGRSVAPVGGSAEDFGYSYLAFPISGLAKGMTLTAVRLELTQISDPTFSTDYAKQNPLEARVLPSGFSEKTWAYADVDKFTPTGGKDGVYGTGFFNSVTAGKDVAILIDLTAGPAKFGKALTDALAKGESTVSIALTSAIDPQGGEKGNFYKVYSKEETLESRRPRLVLTFSN